MNPELEAKIRNVEIGSNGPLVAADLRIRVEMALTWARNEALEEAANGCRVLMEGQTGGVLKILEMAERDIRALKR